MVVVELTPGTHTIKWSLTGYAQLVSVINVSNTGVVTCVSVSSGNCGSATPPGVVVSGNTVTGYLYSGMTPTPTLTPSPTPSTGYSSWVNSKGGPSGIRNNLLAVGEILDGYIGVTQLGFTVSLVNVGQTIDYYLGIGG